MRHTVYIHNAIIDIDTDGNGHGPQKGHGNGHRHGHQIGKVRQVSNSPYCA
jgi:hypothetical protein